MFYDNQGADIETNRADIWIASHKAMERRSASLRFS